MAEEKWITIERNMELHAGDIVELEFTLLSLFDWNLFVAMQLSAIEKRIESDPRFNLLSHTYPEQNIITFKVKINQNPVTAAAIVAIILASSLFVFMANTAMRKLVREVAVSGKEVGATSMQVAVSALVVILGLVILRKER